MQRFARVSALFLALGMAAATLCAAAPTPAPVRVEIDGLLARLQASGCEFNRNGSWYSGADAKAHLLKKLDYLDGKGLAQTAEQFIEKGASSSSVSGKSYLVRCGSAAPVESAAWLLAELKARRAAAVRILPASSPK